MLNRLDAVSRKTEVLPGLHFVRGLQLLYSLSFHVRTMPSTDTETTNLSWQLTS